MNFIFLILLIFNYLSNNCFLNENICHIIKINGTFTGVKVYYRWTPVIKVHSKYDKRLYKMYSNGKEWEFEIKEFNEEITIELNEKSIESIDKNIINRFGVLDLNIGQEVYYNCVIEYKV